MALPKLIAITLFATLGMLSAFGQREGTYFIRNLEFDRNLKANTDKLESDLRIVTSDTANRVKWKLIRKDGLIIHHPEPVNPCAPFPRTT